MTSTDPHTAVMRGEHRATIARTSRAAERARVAYERAVAARDEAMLNAHGERRDGFLSYDEISQASGISKGRVIQIVQPRRKEKSA